MTGFAVKFSIPTFKTDIEPSQPENQEKIKKHNLKPEAQAMT
ncbi:MAG: hypothetical protein N2235_21505 [Fischerella sp.]|nr:hypothetical protein [Fischerella sp.]